MEEEMQLSAQDSFSRLCWSGRTLYDKTHDAVFFNGTYAGFSLRFSGTRLTMDALAFPESYPGEEDSLPWLALFYDGKPEPERVFCLQPGKQAVALFENDAIETHAVTIVKRSEGSKGRAGLCSLTLDGTLLAMLPEVARCKIEFVGDSITCGFGNEMPPEATQFSAEQENGLLSYGAVAARLLDAEAQMICVSGIPLCWARDESYRMTLPWAPEFQPPVRTMEGYYPFADRFHEEREGKTDGLTPWDFSRFVPDAVVINLGTNDAFRIRVSGNDPAEAAHFQARYVAFLEQVREKNGAKAWLVCTLGSMDYFLYDNIEKAAAEYRAKTGDKRVVCFKFGAIDPWGEGMGGLGHPNVKTQLRMGEELAALLKTLL